MKRSAQALLLGLFGALLISLQQWAPDEAPRLAVLEAGTLLSEPVQGRAPGTPLWHAITTSGDPPGIRLGELRVEFGDPTSDDAKLRKELRRSLARALRSLAPNEPLLRRATLSGLDQPDPNGVELTLRKELHRLALSARTPGGETLVSEKTWVAPTRNSLVPPLLVIFLAILMRKPVLALLAGVVVGSILHQDAQGQLGFGMSALFGLRDVFSVYLWNELADNFRFEIVTFVVSVLSFVGIITRAGGLEGLMSRIARIARSARRTQVATNLMGLAIFFDDYANTLLVGSTMRPLSDRFRVSREKLAYIIDSTAAPVAGLSIFSTWVAFEVSTFSAQLPGVGLSEADGFGVFIATLPYRFYCLLTLLFVFFVVASGRDFGPMLRAEQRARGGRLFRESARPMLSRLSTALEPVPGITPRASIAVLPLLTFVLGTLLVSAWGSSDDAPAADGLLVFFRGGSRSLMIGALGGLAVASLLALRAGLRWEILGAAWTTLRSAGVAILILYLAWMIGAVCDALGTAPYLTVLIGESAPAWAIPAVLFLLACTVAFSTGSSWGTMSVLLPIVVGFAYTAGEGSAIGGFGLMVMSIGAVLDGSIFGDHCSPVSDTTILSSISAASDHSDHVRTQIPYAVFSMSAALLLGYLPCAIWGTPPWLSLAVGAGALWTLLRLAGKKAPG